MRKASFQFPQINRALIMCARVSGRTYICMYVCACTHKSSREVLLGWGAWTAMSAVCEGISDHAVPADFTRMCGCLWEGETDRSRETRTDRQTKRDTEGRRQSGDVLWFTVPPPKPEAAAAISVASPRHSRVRMTRGWKWQPAPDPTRQTWFQAATSWLHATVMSRNVDKLF